MTGVDLDLRTIVIDCADPNRLATWWAEVLGWEVRLDDSPVHDGHDWAWAYTSGRDTKLAFQQVPEGKVVKNRLHLDLFAHDVEHEVARVEALGGRRLWNSTDPDDVFVTMGDLEGNEFCICLTSG